MLSFPFFFMNNIFVVYHLSLPSLTIYRSAIWSQPWPRIKNEPLWGSTTEKKVFFAFAFSPCVEQPTICTERFLGVWWKVNDNKKGKGLMTRRKGWHPFSYCMPWEYVDSNLKTSLLSESFFTIKMTLRIAKGEVDKATSRFFLKMFCW